MKVSVELDLTCPRQMAFFTQLIELRDAQSVPQPETVAEPEPAKEWTLSQLRELIGDACEIDQPETFGKVNQILKDFETESLQDLNESQRRIVADEISRYIDNKKAFTDDRA